MRTITRCSVPKEDCPGKCEICGETGNVEVIDLNEITCEDLEGYFD